MPAYRRVGFFFFYNVHVKSVYLFGCLIPRLPQINKRPAEYWGRVMEVARLNNLSRVQRCGQIMGRSEAGEMSSAQIFYPCMQVHRSFIRCAAWRGVATFMQAHSYTVIWGGGESLAVRAGGGVQLVFACFHAEVDFSFAGIKPPPLWGRVGGSPRNFFVDVLDRLDVVLLRSAFSVRVCY